MKNKILIIGIVLFSVLMITFVLAQDEEPQINMPKAGVTPGSIFYGFDVFVDNARATLTPNSLGKAKVRLDIMQERMAEMEEMINENKEEEAQRAELEVRKQMQNFEGSIERVKKKDAMKLNEHIQTHAETLEILIQRLEDYDSDWADAILDALMMLETSENIIANIPEDLDPRATFIISSGSPVTFESLTAQCIEAGEPAEECELIEEMCKEMKATTAQECAEMLSSGFLTGTISTWAPGERPPDPHNCSGHYSSYITQTKWCCDDSDGTYSPEYIEHILSGYDEHISDVLGSSPHMLDYYHRKGTVEYKIINLRTGEIEEGIERDSCDGNTLTEWLCPTVLDRTTRNERYSEEYDCPYDCEDGACINCNLDSICDENEDCSCSDCEGKNNGCGHPHSVCQAGDCVYKMEGVGQECTDSDGGIDYFVKGTVNASYTSGPTTYYYATTDRCINEILREGLCGTNEARVVMYSCPNGCEGGVCI